MPEPLQMLIILVAGLPLFWGTVLAVLRCCAGSPHGEGDTADLWMLVADNPCCARGWGRRDARAVRPGLLGCAPRGSGDPRQLCTAGGIRKRTRSDCEHVGPLSSKRRNVVCHRLLLVTSRKLVA